MAHRPLTEHEALWRRLSLAYPLGVALMWLELIHRGSIGAIVPPRVSLVDQLGMGGLLVAMAVRLREVVDAWVLGPPGPGPRRRHNLAPVRLHVRRCK